MIAATVADPRGTHTVEASPRDGTRYIESEVARRGERTFAAELASEMAAVAGLGFAAIVLPPRLARRVVDHRDRMSRVR